MDGTLAFWEERLKDQGFVRVHRNALVRIQAIRELTANDDLVLPSGRIPVSRRRMEELRRALGI
jgi:DNA-binding LytR/AlgR family response regulator